MKDGVYAKWQGKEYKYGRDFNEERIIITNEVKSIGLGFKLNERTSTYFKKVVESELDEIYSIKTYAIYRGVKCYVRSENGRDILLSLEDMKAAEKLRFGNVDRGCYERWISINEIESFVEEKNTILTNK